ncbi:LysR family transcriptional regulator [Limnohabitans sp. 2KL-51]|uniref:LysR family transcriptional regulator n=1 Tax=Limnohabitans sp. 2KL-51 TaxID=1977911 RepID=UPI000D336D77|nr:LysR family transcriptional regulator [Limnohabitans sp. 2KL-51]PUE46602.1 LysR family transcriptional regulator [Limnohabitans sp. 2KL-51]
MDDQGEIAFFQQIVRYGNLSIAARALGLTPAALSKRLAHLEKRLRVRLINRTTRTFSITPEGQIYFDKGREILAAIDALDQTMVRSAELPVGLLRVNAPLNFGRVRVAPAISAFMREFPDLEVELVLSGHPVNMSNEGIDVAIRLGDLPDSNLLARRIALNRRHLCAASTYLEAHGTPHSLNDLAHHQCIVVRSNDTSFGVWSFVRGDTVENVRVRGRMSCNDGEVALNWALDGQGIMMRSGWDIARYVRSGLLRVVLPEYSLPSRDVYAVFLDYKPVSAKVRVFVDFMAAWMNDLDMVELAGA